MRRLFLAALLSTSAAAAQPAAPPAPPPPPAARVLCLPARGPDPCPKGAALDEDEVRACLARLRDDPRRSRPVRVRVDGGPWVEAPHRGWRCVALPAAAKVRIELEHRGRLAASWKLALDERCPAGIYDVEPGNFYGASYAACSRRRDHRRDEAWPPP